MPPAALACLCLSDSPWGGLSFFSPAYPAFGLISCPPSPKGKDIPPTPFPGGEGGESKLFHARGFAPCIPGAEPARHWFALPLWKTQWGLAPALPARRASAVPGGGRARFVAC